MATGDDLAGCALDEEQFVADTPFAALLIALEVVAPIIWAVVEQKPNARSTPLRGGKQVERGGQDAGENLRSCLRSGL